MTQTDKSSLSDRLNRVGMVSPTLAEGQPVQLDPVRDIETITGEILEAKRVGGEARKAAEQAQARPGRLDL